jgi:hypothetical protein
VKYLGSTLVSELEEEGQSYGDSISADAIKNIVAMVKYLSCCSKHKNYVLGFQ